MESRADASDNWAKSKPSRPPPTEMEREERRGYEESKADTSDSWSKGKKSVPSGEGEGRDRDGYGPPRDRDGYEPPRGRDGYGPPRDRDGYEPPRDRDGYGPPRDRDGYGDPRDDRDRGFGGFGGDRAPEEGRWGKKSLPPPEESEEGPPATRERPKLDLKPRTKPAEEASADTTAKAEAYESKSSPFGAAKPVAVKEVEDKPKPKPEEKKPYRVNKAKSSSDEEGRWERKPQKPRGEKTGGKPEAEEPKDDKEVPVQEVEKKLEETKIEA